MSNDIVGDPMTNVWKLRFSKAPSVITVLLSVALYPPDDAGEPLQHCEHGLGERRRVLEVREVDVEFDDQDAARPSLMASKMDSVESPQLMNSATPRRC